MLRVLSAAAQWPWFHFQSLESLPLLTGDCVGVGMHKPSPLIFITCKWQRRAIMVSLCVCPICEDTKNQNSHFFLQHGPKFKHIFLFPKTGLSFWIILIALVFVQLLIFRIPLIVLSNLKLKNARCNLMIDSWALFRTEQLWQHLPTLRTMPPVLPVSLFTWKGSTWDTSFNTVSNM